MVDGSWLMAESSWLGAHGQGELARLEGPGPGPAIGGIPQLYRIKM